MKKLLLIIMLLSIGLIPLFAERTILIQAAYLNTNRITTSPTEQNKANFSEAGINITSFMGKKLGFYTSVSFLFPFNMRERVNGIDSGMSLNNFGNLTIGLDALLGIGFKVPVTPGISILFAGGLHFNGIALKTADIAYDSYLKYNLGPGLAINALFNITNRFNFNIGAQGAWDMIEFYTIPDLASDENAKGGLTWGLSAGFGFIY